MSAPSRALYDAFRKLDRAERRLLESEAMVVALLERNAELQAENEAFMHELSHYKRRGEDPCDDCVVMLTEGAVRADTR